METLNKSIPPDSWVDGLRAIWYDANGDWQASHNIAQEMHDGLGSWIHAYLHRKEGDKWNADYWYRQAGKSFPNYSLKKEQKEIVEFILLDQ